MNAILALDDAYRDRRYKYQQFLLVNSRPPLDRATAWLQYTAADPDNYGDQEALVYLASRGLDVSRLIESTIEQWKQDEKNAIAASNRGSPIYDVAKNKTTYTNGVPLSESSDIENVSEFQLREFWHGRCSRWMQRCSEPSSGVASVDLNDGFVELRVLLTKAPFGARLSLTGRYHTFSTWYGRTSPSK